MKVMLIGPSNGIPDGNREAFRKAASRVSRRGFNAICMTVEDTFTETPPWQANLMILTGVRGLVAMPGFEQDPQARLLAGIAGEVGMVVYDFPSLNPIHPNELPRFEHPVR